MQQAFFPQGYDLTNPEYLEANRQGQVHPEQQKILSHPLANMMRFLQKGDTPSLSLAFLFPLLVILGVIAVITLDVPAHLIFQGGLALALILVGVALYGFLRARQKNQTRKRELNQGRVRSATGELTFQKGQYVIQAQDQTLDLPFLGLSGIGPGIKYRFYYLPESQTALSAEQLSRMGAHQAQEHLTRILAEANGFKLETLPQNQSGSLTTGQMVRLLPQTLILLALSVFLFGVLYRILQPYFLGQNWSDFPTGQLVIGGFLVLLGSFALIMFTRSMLDILSGQVLILEGPGYSYKKTSSDSDGGTKTKYFYRIGEQEFSVSRKAYGALIDGLTYRAYYTPNRKKLVNIEALEGPAEDQAAHSPSYPSF